jgi:hypothetical protein
MTLLTIILVCCAGWLLRVACTSAVDAVESIGKPVHAAPPLLTHEENLKEWD